MLGTKALAGEGFCPNILVKRKEILMTTIPTKQPNRKHGSPYDRGSADRYYQRKFEPHYYPDGTGKGLRVTAELMHRDELKEYSLGYWEEDDRKDYG